MTLPSIILTGASGFIGRHLLNRLKERYLIHAFARRSQIRCGAPIHRNIRWYLVDITEAHRLKQSFRAARAEGPIDYLIHLAAHYDFTGDDHPEYWRTNVDGLRNVLLEASRLELRRFVFASSVAACRFPAPGSAINEDSPPDGDHVYAVSKRMGEEMLAEFDETVPSCIVRFAALFSDWCEYPPLYFFLCTWLSNAWNRRVLGGRGFSAIPYLHVRDAAGALHRILGRAGEIRQREVFNISGDGATTHRELFDAALAAYSDESVEPILMPKPFCVIGVHLMTLIGRALGNMPFERPWMMRYLDRSLTIDSRRTRERLGWAPRERLDILRRIPFILEHLKTDPELWHQRNREAMREFTLRPNLIIHRLLERHQEEMRQEFTKTVMAPENRELFPGYQQTDPDVLAWRHKVITRHLLSAIRVCEKGIFMNYCHDLAEKRFEEGFPVDEVCRAMQILSDISVRTLLRDPEGAQLDAEVHRRVVMTIRFGCDQILETYERLAGIN